MPIAWRRLVVLVGGAGRRGEEAASAAAEVTEIDVAGLRRRGEPLGQVQCVGDDRCFGGDLLAHFVQDRSLGS